MRLFCPSYFYLFSFSFKAVSNRDILFYQGSDIMVRTQALFTNFLGRMAQYAPPPKKNSMRKFPSSTLTIKIKVKHERECKRNSFE